MQPLADVDSLLFSNLPTMVKFSQLCTGIKPAVKERNLGGAVAAFKQHITDYPSSPYLANAYYWLGEIYLLEGQDELARQAFTMVVEKHPSHGKALDANFKLGKIYHQLGELERARTLLETAAQGAGGASNKAKSYLQNNF